jgi:hypothetical protein
VNVTAARSALKDGYAFFARPALLTIGRALAADHVVVGNTADSARLIDTGATPDVPAGRAADITGQVR